jgi:hypothetical protein
MSEVWVTMQSTSNKFKILIRSDFDKKIVFYENIIYFGKSTELIL